MCQKGFTLIEALASVAILGLGLLAVIRLFSGSLGLARASSDSTAKVLFAKQKVREILIEDKTEERAQKGSSGGFEWILNVTGFDGQAPLKGSKILKIDLTVSSSSGAPVRITTLKTVSSQN